jgi:hypothetical protein
MSKLSRILGSLAILLISLSASGVASAQSNESKGHVKLRIATDKYPVKIEQIGDSVRITRIYDEPSKKTIALSFAVVGAGQLFNVVATKKAIDRGAHEINPVAGNPRRIAIGAACAAGASAILYNYKPSWRKWIVRLNFTIGGVAAASGAISSFASR